MNRGGGEERWWEKKAISPIRGPATIGRPCTYLKPFSVNRAPVFSSRPAGSAYFLQPFARETQRLHHSPRLSDHLVVRPSGSKRTRGREQQRRDLARTWVAVRGGITTPLSGLFVSPKPARHNLLPLSVTQSEKAWGVPPSAHPRLARCDAALVCSSLSCAIARRRGDLSAAGNTAAASLEHRRVKTAPTTTAPWQQQRQQLCRWSSGASRTSGGSSWSSGDSER